MKEKKTLRIMTVLVAVLLLGVGYAAITGINLNITGTASATASGDNFNVQFTGTPTTDVTHGGTGATTTATIVNTTSGSIVVSGLTTKDQYVTATYTIANESTELYANLAQTTCAATGANASYFNVTCATATAKLNPKNDSTSDETTLTVTVTLAKTPSSDVTNVPISVTFAATPSES